MIHAGRTTLLPPTRPGFLAPQGSGGDVIHLDELTPIDRTPIQTASLTTDTTPYANEVLQPIEPELPPGARNGIFQKVRLSGTWTPALGDEPDTLGVTDFDTAVVLGFPFFRRDTPLLVTPRFAVHLFDQAARHDLPSRVYDASLELRHLRKFGDGPWAMDAAVTVGYYSDFEIDSGEAVRVTGRGLAVYESSPAAKWIVGVAYVNRAGASVLPVAGLLYEPADDVRWELIFPRPRVAWRMPGSSEADGRWVYLGGEFGGGVWAIARRSTGLLDVVSYSDLRVVAGYERKLLGGISRRYEIGYVFDREIDYESATPDVSLDDSLFVRAGFSF